MKQTITFIITTFLLIFYISVLNAQNLLVPQPNFKGKVIKCYEMTKGVADRMGEWSFEHIDLEQGRGSETQLDEQGDYLSVTNFVKDGQYPRSIQYKKDSKGQFQKAKMESAYAEFDFDFFYNGKGQLQKTVISGGPENKVLETYEYLYQDKKHTQTTFKAMAQDTQEVILQFVDDHIVSSIRKDPNGKTIYETKYTNNKFGDPIAIEYFDTDGSATYQEIFQYRYDEKGNWITSLLTDTKTDIRTQIDRAFVYKEANDNNILSKSELKNAWIGFNNDMVLIFNNQAVNVVNRNEKNSHEDSYHYNPLSGELSLSMKARQNAKSFVAQFDGTMLSLTEIKGDSKLLFQKLDDNNFSNFSLSYFHYRQVKTFMNQTLDVAAYKENDLYGLKAADGKIILSPTYSYIQIKEDAILAIEDNKYGLLAANGKPLTPIAFEQISPSPMGYYLFKKEGLKGIMDPKGKVIVPAQYKRLFLLNDQFLFVADSNYKGVINLKNEMLLPIKYTSDSFKMPYKFNRSVGYKRVGGHGIDWINDQFEIIKSFDEQSNITRIVPIDVNCFAVKNRAIGWGLVDSLFNEIMAPSYQDLDHCTNQLMRVKKGDKYGLINTAGKEVAPVIYDQIIYNFNPKKPVIEWYNLIAYEAAVGFIKGDEVGYLDGQGKEISLKLSPFVASDYFYKKVEIAGIFTFKRSDDWKKIRSQTFTTFGKVEQTSVEYSIEDSGADFKNWINSNYTNRPLKEIRIAGQPAYTFIEVDPTVADGGLRRQYVFIPIKNNQTILFQFKCSKKDYFKMAQEFYNIMNTIEIIK